ncbi:MAG: adenylosuccinate synthetase [Gemmatimonadaceae bacterium]
MQRLGLVVLLSGPVAGGKTTLAENLSDTYKFAWLKTRELISALKDSALERTALQGGGAALDEATKGAWVGDALARYVTSVPDGTNVLVDAVRTAGQIESVRKGFGPRVVHVHVTAPIEILERRYLHRKGAVKELESYDAVRSDPTEANVESLAALADIVIDTARSRPEDVFARVAARLGLYGRSYQRLVDVLIGGQYGSEGKGNIAAYLAPEYDVLVRVGGPNAGHTVYEEPKPTKFYHIPSGTMRAPGAQIVLGPGSVIRPSKFFEEVNQCGLEVGRLFVDPQAMIIEDEDIASEGKSLKGSIGSTGQGVGFATARKVLRGALPPPVRLARDIEDFKPYVRPTLDLLDDAFAQGRRVFLEGTQGTALSLHHGAYPFVTSRETSVSGCLADAGIAPSRVRRAIMVCRTYPIRVESPAGGTSGPMGTEITWQDVSHRSEIPLKELTEAEITTTTKRSRRVAEFDWKQLRQAVSLNGPTDIALSFTDYLGIENRKARRFEQLDENTIQFVEEVERVAAVRVSLIVTRFHYRNIIDRRIW